MAKQLNGMLAVVTGAGGGIGRSICLEFAGEGARIAAVDIQEENLEETVRQCGPGHKGFKTDVSKADEVEQSIKDIISSMGQAPQILVNCAGGIYVESTILDMSEEGFDKVLAVNLKGVFLMTQQVAKAMVADSVKDAVIVNISSECSKKPYVGLSHYCASKAAVSSFTRCTALELVEHGIRCNAVCPGPTRTPLYLRQPKEIVEKESAAIPMKRIAEPKEVAELCVFLASGKSKYITGEEILIDGGLLLT